MSIIGQAILSLLSLPVALLAFILFRVVRQYVRQRSLHDIPGPAPASIVTGNLKDLLGLNSWGFHAHLAKSYGKVVRIWGLFGDTQLYVRDPRALHHILIKEQYVFEETDMFIAGNAAAFGKGLLATLGDHHRRQRKLLNPVFSIKHMRYMVPIFWRVSAQLVDVMKKKVANGTVEIDVLDWNTRVALELVGQGGLGHSFNCLDEFSESPYTSALKNFVPTLTRLNLWRQFLPWVCNIGTPALRHWIGVNIPWPNVNRLVHLSDVMYETSKMILTEKKAALEKGDSAVVNQIGEGRDIMSILLKANMAAAEQDRLPEDELLAQMSTLTFAAMDTTSTALSRTIHLLAYNQDVQDRLRQEVNTALNDAGGTLDYDALMTLPFLEAVCRETLRVFPPITQVLRTTKTDAILPLGTPIVVNNHEVSELYIPGNTNVIAAIKSVNTDTDIWGNDGAVWKPERWLSPLPETVTNAGIPGVYSNTLTFIGGGRACIGFKFSELEMKIVLCSLISNFRYFPSKANVEWKSSNIATPMVNGKPSMPMMLSLAGPGVALM